MGHLRNVTDCPHGSIIRREAGAGTPLNGLYCLDCGSLVKRGTGVGAATQWIRIGPIMDGSALKDLRARLNWEKDPPNNIRLAPDAPGYAVADDPKD